MYVEIEGLANMFIRCYGSHINMLIVLSRDPYNNRALHVPTSSDGEGIKTVDKLTQPGREWDQRPFGGSTQRGVVSHVPTDTLQQIIQADTARLALVAEQLCSCSVLQFLPFQDGDRAAVGSNHWWAASCDLRWSSVRRLIGLTATAATESLIFAVGGRPIYTYFVVDTFMDTYETQCSCCDRNFLSNLTVI